MNDKRPLKGTSSICFPNNYVLIDIETTGLSPDYDEIIELAAIKVCNNEIIDTFSSFVKPSFEIDEFITELTGITNSMVSNAPDITSVIDKYLDFIGENIIIGHNVNFDINFIYDFAQKNGYNFSNDFVDTMRLFRKLHPELKHHRLSDMCSLYKIDYSHAHRSLSDCELTMNCYYSLIKEISENFSSCYDFIATFNRTKTTLKASNILATVDKIDSDNQLYGKVFVFTGTLEKMLRKEAIQIVVNHGGINGDNVTKNTNYLVLGNNDYCPLIKDGKSTKQKKAEKLKLSGQDIEIISENVFYDMISG